MRHGLREKGIAFPPRKRYTICIDQFLKERCPMIHLFPKREKRLLILCACYLALVGVYLALNRAANPIPVLLIAAVGLAIVVISRT